MLASLLYFGASYIPYSANHTGYDRFNLPADDMLIITIEVPGLEVQLLLDGDLSTGKLITLQTDTVSTISLTVPFLLFPQRRFQATFS
jgi:hypothetical protein